MDIYSSHRAPDGGASSPPRSPAPASGAPRDPVNAALYSIWQAARLAQFSRPTVRRWLAGRRLCHHETSLGLAPSPLRPGTVRRPPDTYRLTFAEVLTLRVVKGLRTTGYSMWTIRRIATMAEREFGCRAPLATQRFRAEGALLFLRIDEATHYMYAQEAAESGRDPVAAMVWQSVFRDVLDLVLFRDVDWQGGVAARWWPLGRDAGIAVDPRV